MKEHWLLDPTITFLNHGSFGAAPKAVLAKQSELRTQLEREPVRFMVRELEPLLDEARAALAAFVGAEPAAIAFVPNATAGVNAVLRSLDLDRHDELLVTTHEYNASRNALEYVAGIAGAKVVAVDIPFPLRSSDEIVERVLAAVTDRTRLLLIDHVTSQTGLIFPIATSHRGAEPPRHRHARRRRPRARHVPAQAGHPRRCLLHRQPSQVGLRSERRRVSLRPRKSPPRHPSCGDQSRRECDAHRSQPLPPRIRLAGYLRSDRNSQRPHCARNSWPASSTAAGPKSCAAITNSRYAPATFSAPASASNIRRRTTCSAQWPRCHVAEGKPYVPTLYGDPLQDALFEHNIEVPIHPWPHQPKRVLRVSAQLYNEIGDYKKLADALEELLPKF